MRGTPTAVGPSQRTSGGSIVRLTVTVAVTVAMYPPWIGTHIAFMGGGYIATVTATVTVNLTMLPPLVRWLSPTAVGVPLIVYATRSYVPRFSRPE